MLHCFSETVVALNSVFLYMGTHPKPVVTQRSLTPHAGSHSMF